MRWELVVVGEDRRKDIHESIEEYRAINSLITHPEVRIYKRKEESKKKRKFFFFLVAFLFESVFSFFFSWPLSFFLGRERVFFLFSFFYWLIFWSKACFLTFLFSFINPHLFTRKALALYVFLEVLLPNEPSCPSVGRLVGRSVGWLFDSSVDLS